jgi:hypothetical protein
VRSLGVKFFDPMNMQTIQKPTSDKTFSTSKAKSTNRKGTFGCEKLIRPLHSDPPDALKQSVQAELDFPILRKMSVNIRISQPIRFESVEDKNGFI